MIGSDKECLHTNEFVDHMGLHICRDCCREIHVVDYSPEWAYYGGSDNRSTKDPSRCQKGKSILKSIDDVFEARGVEISDAMKNEITIKYNKMIANNSRRTKARTAAVAVCHYYTSRSFGQNRTSEHIAQLYNIDHKSMSKAFLQYNRIIDNNQKNFRPVELIKWLMDILNINHLYYEAIACITEYVEDTSEVLKRSTPQAVASGVIYYYLELNKELKKKMGLTKKVFAQMVGLSELTIDKLLLDIKKSIEKGQDLDKLSTDSSSKNKKSRLKKNSKRRNKT
jgi:transcription initiation factor TFIIIB Brf1 subunit/transcription initiation factor TFIIB